MTISPETQKILDSIPCRNYLGEKVPLAPFKAHVRLLRHYQFDEKELEILKGEIDELKKALYIKREEQNAI